MPEVRITRGKSATRLTRGQVEPGMVFALQKRDGSVSETNYANIGTNGRQYSLNVATKLLASSTNRNKPVVLTGTYTIEVRRLPQSEWVVKRRRELKSGDVFVVNDGKSGKSYAHIGTADKDGGYKWLALIPGNLENHAVTENGDKKVKVVGKMALNVKLV